VEERKLAMARRLAARDCSMWGAHAVLMVDGDAEKASQTILSHLGQPIAGPFDRVGSGTFDLLASMLLVCRWGDRLSREALDHVRGVFEEGILHRGNTENHWLMHYTGNLLAAERWPELEMWWNGLPREAMHAEATRWISGTIRRTARVGHYEYDSPQYHLCHVLAMLGLAEHAGEEELRSLARKNLTLLIADVALEYFHGAWAGGHSREGYRQNTWTHSGSVVALQYLYFGAEGFEPGTHDHDMIGPALAADYCPPAVLASMARERQAARVVVKTKPPRAVYRHVPGDGEPTRKYTYLSPSFALASTQVGLPGGCAGPIDLVSWDLSWRGPRHQAKIVANHPYREPRRFSAFLPGLPHTIGRAIATDKPYLQYPDRLFGASPFERMVQHEGCLIVLYRIPDDDLSPYVNLYLPTGVGWLEEEGWLFGQMEGFYTAIYPIGPYTWETIHEENLVDGWLLQIQDRCVGLVLEAAEVAVAGSFCQFRRARRQARVDVSGWPDPGRVVAGDTRGHSLVLEYAVDEGGSSRTSHQLDGEEIDYAAYPLLGAPGVEAPLGTGRIVLECDGQRAELDFGPEVDPASLPTRVVG